MLIGGHRSLFLAKQFQMYQSSNIVQYFAGVVVKFFVYLPNTSQIMFWGNYPSIFILSGKSYDSKNIFQSRLYMPQICGDAKKSETFWAV